jgi:hypothetical protein
LGAAAPRYDPSTIGLAELLGHDRASPNTDDIASVSHDLRERDFSRECGRLHAKI